MPKSRHSSGRRSGSRTGRRHQARRTRRQDVVVSTSVADFLDMLTPADLRLIERAREAEDKGDFSGALALLRRTPRPVDSPWELELVEMASLGDRADTWRFGRWLISAAARWTATDPAMPSLQRIAAEAAQEIPGPSVQEYAGWVSGTAALRTVIEDHALFELGLLHDYLQSRVSPALARRAGPVEDWPDRRHGAAVVSPALRGRSHR